MRIVSVKISLKWRYRFDDEGPNATKLMQRADYDICEKKTDSGSPTRSVIAGIGFKNIILPQSKQQATYSPPRHRVRGVS